MTPGFLFDAAAKYREGFAVPIPGVEGLRRLEQSGNGDDRRVPLPFFGLFANLNQRVVNSGVLFRPGREVQGRRVVVVPGVGVCAGVEQGGDDRRVLVQ